MRRGLLICCIAMAILTGEGLSKEGSSKEEFQVAKAAEGFINAYLRELPKFKSYRDSTAWVKRQPLASASFKKRLENLYREASKKDPELGYGADAVLGAQDFPDAFKVQTIQIRGDRALVKLVGLGQPNMALRMVLTRHDSRWLVHASGDVKE